MIDALLGAEIGPFRLERLLGRGGMGRVYLGVHGTIGSRVAIKVLSEDACEEPDAVERFLAEARAVASIRHDGIVAVHDFVMLPGGRPAIVMELVEGPTLRQVIDGGPVPVATAEDILRDVLAALGAVHAIGIVHRDLKPDNIIIGTSGRAKLLDFGIAKLALRAPGGPRTRTGAVLGTPHYMSPEQIQGDAVDARSDLYALGAVVYETLAGTCPFGGASDFEVMVAQVETAPPALREVRPDVPPALAEVVARALAKRRGDRFESAADMVAALDGRTVDTRRARPIRRRRTVTGLALAGLAVAGGVAYVIAMPHDPEAEPVAIDHPDSYLVADPTSRTTAREVVPKPGLIPVGFAEPVVEDAPAVGPLRMKVNYNIHSFDLMAWLPIAEREARRKASDARMWDFSASGVRRDGRIDMRDANVWIDFRSAQPPCKVRVVPGDDHVNVWGMSASSCTDMKAPPPPTCSFAKLWSRALERLSDHIIPETATAEIIWDAFAQHWTFNVNHNGITLDDRC